MDLTHREIRQLAMRLLCLQVPLNCRTMQGAGYLFALWPWLRKNPERELRAKAAGDYLNAHPVFAALAVGALRKRLSEGEAEKNPRVFSEWQTSLCGPLGMAGDALIWDRWKPLIFGFGAAVVLAVPSVTIWFITALCALLVYNVPLHFLRLWGIQTGYRLGEHVLDALNNPRIAQARQWLTMVGVLLTGALFALGWQRTGHDSLLRGAQFIFAAALTWILMRRRWNFTWLALTVIAVTLLLPGVIKLF